MKENEVKNADLSLNRKEFKNDKLYVIPLGGLDEIGKNMTLIQYNDEIIVIDAGMAFPDNELLGIDIVLPDYNFLEKNKEKVKGIFITHGHEDHIGGIPYMYEKIDKKIPLYIGKLGLELVKSKFEEKRFGKQLPKMKEIKSRSKIKAGKYLTVEFIRITHSTADAYALAITTPLGTIFHTGDFKIDLTPVNGMGVDFLRLSQIGDKGVELMLSDSTNSEVEGYTPSEKTVGIALKKEFERATGRIIISAFSSHLHRIQQIVEIASFHKRKIAIDGRSMVKIFEIASRIGYIKVPENMLITLEEAEKIPGNKVVILCTGTQGEPMAALSRIAKGIHKTIKLHKGDSVVISATPIPGNERAVYDNINRLLKTQAEVVFKKIAGIHVSGHASKDEQKLMLNLIKPKYFMPVHGEYKMLKAHKESAIEVGIPEKNILICTNGDRVEILKNKVKKSGKVNSGIVLVDGLGVGDVGTKVLRDRQQLSKDGVVIVTLALTNNFGDDISFKVDLQTKGFIYSKESNKLLNGALENIDRTIQKIKDQKIKDNNKIKNIIKENLSRYFYTKIKRNPIIIPSVIQL